MKGFFYILLFILVAMLSWGVYGPMLKVGQTDMHGAWRPFMCVGLAYFLIAVVVPTVILQLFGEKGHWSAGGATWSMLAGVCGAVGALGIILAAKNGGNMLYVMPLVFGGAPVVNSIVTIFLARTYKQVGPIFIAGLILVIAGSVTVLLTAPHTPSAGGASLEFSQLALVCLFTAMTAVAFGCYGPTLHKGQVAMAGSRLRPFLCVGIAYFLVAVLVPALLLGTAGEASQWTFKGTAWSVGGGAAGAIGALGVIMAFNLGGKPIYVMPLVFGGAPVINTFVEVAKNSAWGRIGPLFYAGLIMTAAGAVTVLVFAPRSHAPAHGAAPAAEPAPSKIEPKAKSV
jgi:hypothetical protein